MWVEYEKLAAAGESIIFLRLHSDMQLVRAYTKRQNLWTSRASTETSFLFRYPDRSGGLGSGI